MKANRFVFAMACFALSGCLLQKDKEPSVQQAKLRAVGVIMVEDLAGKEQSGYLVAGFSRPSSRSAESPLRLLSPQWEDWDLARWQPRLAVRADPEATVCEVGRHDSADIDSARGSLLSVGEMKFGPANQATLVSVPEDADHRYLLALPSGFSSEARQVKASGAGDIPGFTAVFTVPEPLPGAQLMGQAFSPTPLIIRKSQPLTVEWDRPFVINDASLVILEIGVKQGDKKTSLLCAGYEAKAAENLGAKLRWSIPASQVQKLPFTTDAAVYFSRAHMKTLGSSVLEVDVDTRRTWGATGRIED